MIKAQRDLLEPKEIKVQLAQQDQVVKPGRLDLLGQLDHKDQEERLGHEEVLV